jgi:hypothetical protein
MFRHAFIHAIGTSCDGLPGRKVPSAETSSFLSSVGSAANAARTVTPTLHLAGCEIHSSDLAFNSECYIDMGPLGRGKMATSARWRSLPGHFHTKKEIA